MTRRGSTEREQYWRGLIEEQVASELPIAAFCRDRKVAEGSFFYWRRKLNNGQLQKRTGGEAIEPRRRNSVNNGVEKFVPVDIPTANCTAGAICEVMLPNGCRVIVPRDCDARWLGEILGVLGE